LADQEVFAPGESVNVEALVYALAERDALMRKLGGATAEIVRAFDQLGWAMQRLDLLKDSDFWRKNGPVDPNATLAKM
jgi:hypothetical protein